MSWVEKHLIKNELARKRYRRLKKSKMAVASLWIFLALLFFSATAELWANSRPVVMEFGGHLYVPVINEYHPSTFGQEGFVTNYRALEFKDSDWALWPLAQWDPYESNTLVSNYPAPPSRYNWMGTDDRGRDVFARLLYGFRYSLIFAVSAWIFTYLVGCVLGAIMGYMGGVTDLVGMRVVEVIQSVPQLLLLLTLVSIFSPNLPFLIIFFVVFGWTAIALYMRAEFLSLRKREYVDGARAIGASHARIIFRHILPNALTPIVTFSPFEIAGNITGLVILDYLGFGLRAPTPSWGELLGQAQKYFAIAEWLVLYPCAAIVLTLVLLINIGNAIRDAYDSKLAL
ncbi:MAG: ABC transporter permease subunit [Pseudobdellovibrionaceae bacterium]